MTTTPDVVYILAKKSQYEELRYSLRSLRNIPHGKVFIAGACPEWAQNVIHVPVDRVAGETRYQNAERNWYGALTHPELSDDYITMNDDFYIMRPIDAIEYYHDGSLREYLKVLTERGATHPNYLNAMQITLDILRSHGIADPNGYLLHVPMIMNKQKRLELHDMFVNQIEHGEILLMRTLYGNLYDVGGTHMHDVKFLDGNFDHDLPFLSTNDPGFKYEAIGDFIRDTFSEKSEYER